VKKYFLTGLAFLLPVTLTGLLFLFLLNLFTEPFVGLVHKWLGPYYERAPWGALHHAAAIDVISRLIALIGLLLLICFIGFLAHRLLFQRGWNLMEKILHRIPLVRTIFRITKEMTSSVFSSEKNPFQKVVVVPFLNHDMSAIAFVTGPVPESIKRQLPTPVDHFVFVPNSPHPLSGFLLMASSQHIQEIPMKGEQALKILFSAGIVQEPRPETPASK